MQRVLIVENESLLGAGVQSFLAGEAGLELIGVSPHNQVELVREIRRVRPDVVVLDEDSRLTDPTELLAFMKNYPKLRVVAVNAKDNVVRVYNCHEVLLRRTSDLLGIIRDY